MLQNYLKEIKNHARIYVQRIGFDPPPIKEQETRLSGDLDEVSSNQFSDVSKVPIELPKIRETLIVINDFKVDNSKSALLKASLEASANELAVLAIENPGQHLKTLTTIRQILDNKHIDPSLLEIVETSFLKILPQDLPKPISNSVTRHELVDLFMETYESERP